MPESIKESSLILLNGSYILVRGYFENPTEELK